jgi:hypothetical protein
VSDEPLPPSYEYRLAALEARVLALEARLATTAPPSTGQAGAHDDSEAWLNEVQARALRGDRAGAIAVYLENMGGSDEQEAAYFVDELIEKPPSGS